MFVKKRYEDATIQVTTLDILILFFFFQPIATVMWSQILTFDLVSLQNNQFSNISIGTGYNVPTSFYFTGEINLDSNSSNDWDLQLVNVSFQYASFKEPTNLKFPFCICQVVFINLYIYKQSNQPTAIN